MRICYSIILAAVLLTCSLGAPATALAATPQPPPGIQVTSSPTGLVVEWVAPETHLVELPDGASELRAEGYAQLEQPGQLTLPFTSTLLAVPPGAAPSLRLTIVSESVGQLPESLRRAPYPQGALQSEEGLPYTPSFEPGPADPTPVAESPVVLEEIGIQRGVRLARLVFYPALPQEGRLRLFERVRAEVRWNTQAQATADTLDAMQQSLRDAVINPWGVAAAQPDATTAADDTLATALDAPPTGFVRVSQPGLYRLTYETLSARGFSGADPHGLRLFQGAREIACLWEGDDDTQLEPGEALVFYAEPRTSRWSNSDAIRLVADTTPGLRMNTRSADPAGVSTGTAWVAPLFEQNTIYTGDYGAQPDDVPAGQDGDRWVWQRLQRDPISMLPVSASFVASLSAVTASRPATLTLWLISYTALPVTPDHQVDVSLNDTTVGRVEWDGVRAITATLTVPANVLHTGDNTLRLTLPQLNQGEARIEGMWLDAFSLTYARSTEAAGSTVQFGGSAPRRAYTVALTSVGPYEAYDTSDPHRPVRLTGVRVEGQTVTVADPPAGGPRRYFVSAASAIQTADLRSAVTWTEPTGSDVLIIAPGNLVSSLAPLVALRKSQGLHTTVANLQAIYDLWSDGRPTPQAIRAFIAHAYATWSPRPSYVLLVGDGSYDPRRYLPSSPPTLIPPYLMKVDAWTSEGAADNRYVCMDGEHDMLADMHLGRLPVQSVAQAEALVQKIVAYESDPLPGNWNRWVRLVADDQEGQEGTALDFPAVSDAYSASYASAPYWVGRTYCLGGDPARNDCPAAETETIRTSLVRALNEGGLFVQYTGHSSWQQWAHERFFHLDDLPALNNAGRLPVFVEMTCYTAAFHRPEPTLDESLVTLPQTGAAAAWGPTGLGVGSGHQRLASGFFEAVFVDEVETLGEATWAGRLELHSTYPSHYMLDAYVLLGDPAMQVHTDLLPWSQSVYLPLTFSGLH